MPKIIFLDVDGTLVNYETQVPESAAEAVGLARANGHQIYLVTGRARPEVPEVLWDLGIDGMIGGNGSYIEHNNQVIQALTLSKAECTEVVHWLTEQDLPFYLEANSGLYASAEFDKKAQGAIEAYAAGKGNSGPTRIKVTDVLPGLIFGADLNRDDVNKISFKLNDYQDYLDAKAKFPHLKVGTWGGRGSHALFGDIGVPDIDKANAINVLLNHLETDQSQTIGVGDAAIDIPMLEFCDIAVAMGNSPDNVKAVADYITADVDHNGLHQAFAHLGLI